MTEALSKITTASQSDNRMNGIPGPVRVAILLLALGEERGSAIWQTLNDDEIRQVSSIMAKLGTISREHLDSVVNAFIDDSSAEKLDGGPEPTEKILMSALSRQRAKSIIEEIRIPENPNLWQKIEQARPEQVSNFLAREYPQTIAIILARMKADAAAKIFARLPSQLASDVLDRMTRIESVPEKIIQEIGLAIENEFMAAANRPKINSPIEHIANILNTLDKRAEIKLLGALDYSNKNASQQLRSIMFSFDDLSKLNSSSIQTLIRSIERELLIKALKGASKPTKEFFYSQMSQRAARGFQDDMEALGPIRLKEVDDAQRSIVNLAKDLASKGEIVLSLNSDDEMVS